MRASLSLVAAGSVALAAAACFTSNGDPPGGSVGDAPVIDGSGASGDGAPASDANAAADAASDANPMVTDGGGDARVDPPACNAYASPTTSAQCHGCPARHVCQVNGCYGGYWCEVGPLRCVPHPAICP